MKYLKKLKDKLDEQLEGTAEEFSKRPTSKSNYDIYIIFKNLKMLKEYENEHEDTYKHSDDKKGLWS